MHNHLTIKRRSRLTTPIIIIQGADLLNKLPDLTPSPLAAMLGLDTGLDFEWGGPDLVLRSSPFGLPPFKTQQMDLFLGAYTAEPVSVPCYPFLLLGSQ